MRPSVRRPGGSSLEHTRFDAITRKLGTRLPRRGVLRLVAALTAAGVVGSPEEGAAKAKHRKKCPTGQRRCGGGKHQPCVGCCTDADCGGNACTGGVCADCPKGQRSCRGGCIAVDACCVDADCTGNRVCTEGTCDCAPSDRLCQGVCINRRDCCGTDCPPTNGGGGGGTPQTCTAATCNGCCDGTQCREGVTDNNCGRGGGACVACAAGTSCDAGVCTGAGSCSPESCDGCCNRGSCHEGDSQNFCGRGGVTCAACRARESCDAGSCVCPTECCGDADCTARSGGRCTPGGTCAYPPICLTVDTPIDGCTNADTAQCCNPDCCNPISPSHPFISCCPSGPGQPCNSDSDCFSGFTCSFFTCVSST